MAMSIHITILRTKMTERQTLGTLFVWQGERKLYECATLELPWVGNQRRVSCIPAGTYTCRKHRSPRFASCIWVQQVPNRDGILIHVGNFVRQIEGCILPGKAHRDIDRDGLVDVANSADALRGLLAVLPDTFPLRIIEV